MGPWAARSNGWSQVSDVESARCSPGAAAEASGRCSCHMAIITTRVSVEIAAMPREQFQLPMSRLSVGSQVVRLRTYATTAPKAVRSTRAQTHRSGTVMSRNAPSSATATRT
jgi:hypothetical protein